MAYLCACFVLWFLFTVGKRTHVEPPTRSKGSASNRNWIRRFSWILNDRDHHDSWCFLRQTSHLCCIQLLINLQKKDGDIWDLQAFVASRNVWLTESKIVVEPDSKHWLTWLFEKKKNVIYCTRRSLNWTSELQWVLPFPYCHKRGKFVTIGWSLTNILVSDDRLILKIRKKQINTGFTTVF